MIEVKRVAVFSEDNYSPHVDRGRTVRRVTDNVRFVLCHYEHNSRASWYECLAPLSETDKDEIARYNTPYDQQYEYWIRWNGRDYRIDITPEQRATAIALRREKIKETDSRKENK